ncbi:MAG: SDR family oxidoreductase [Ignavibacteriae bacterium]|nr:MAG: SDR family oxidoreductase [Ignavibacteriota bacterium]
MKIDLTQKVALVTGGSRGIGAAIVKILAEAGADIAFTYIADKTSAAHVESVVKKSGRRCMVLQTSVSNQKQVHSAVRKIMRRFGRIDILVNNAGIWKYGAIGRMTEDQWDETIDINLKGMFLFTNEVVPIMKKQESGKMINIASTAGQRGEAFHSHYAASKGGMIAFTKSIGAELAPHHIIVNCVAPGWVATDMSERELRDPGIGEEIRRIIPRGRVATPEEIAGSVLFLASELSNHLVGSIVSVNGGAVMSN